MDTWYMDWDMWSAIGQMIGAIGTIIAVLVATKTASNSQKLSERSLEISEQSIKLAKEALEQQQDMIKDERTPSIQLIEDTEEYFYFKVIATNVKSLPITIEECFIDMVGEIDGIPCIKEIRSLTTSQALPHILKQGDQLSVSISKFELRKYAWRDNKGPLNQIIFVFVDSLRKRHELDISYIINKEENDIRISEYEPYGAYMGNEISYDPIKDEVEIIHIQLGNSNMPLPKVKKNLSKQSSK